MLFTFKIEASAVCRYCGSKLARDKAPQWRKKGETKKRGETGKKTFPLSRLPLGSLRCPIYLHFFFLSPNLEPGPRLVVSQQLKKKKGPKAYTNKLPLYGARISRYPGNDLFSGYKEQSLPALTRLSTTICHKNKPKSEAFSNFQLYNLYLT